MVDLTVERMQNRQGLKINLPQPLRPGELGFCTDTKEMYIGGEPINIAPGVQITNGNYLAAQSILFNQILVAATDGSFAGINSVISVLTPFPTSAENAYYIPETGEVYVGVELADLVGVQAAVDGVTGVTSSTYNMNKTVDADGGVTFTYHTQSNAVAAMLNALSSLPIAISQLNVEVITEYSNWRPSFPADQLVTDPITVKLPQSIPFADVPPIDGGGFPALEYDATESDTVIIDYSISYNVGVNNYNSSGTLTVMTNLITGTSILTDENTELTNPAIFPYAIDFQATHTPAIGLDPAKVTIQYTHNFPINVDPLLDPLLKVTTKRWLSF